ncbi:MAG TPA: hypothetical protein V6C65_35805 [Allocoleopsis sp.]
MNELLSLDEERFASTAQTWLEESGELLVDWYQVNGRQDSHLFILSSAQDLVDLVDRAKMGDRVTVVRGQHFLVRGLVNDQLVAQAELILNPIKPCVVMKPQYYPNPLSELATATGGRVIRRLLSEFVGELVWVGEAIRIVALDDLTSRDEWLYLFGKK